jgi:hypothetical protein
MGCFAGLTHLSSLTFESGSRLREIGDSAFADCHSLKSISLPASLAVVSGLSFAESSIERVVVDESNPHYFISGDFLVGFEGMILIRYFGHSESVIIERNIGSIGRSCFRECRSLESIVFESDSRLSILGECAFSECRSLKSICIPAQVERISDSCFRACRSLAEVKFEPGSKLTRIDYEAFARCHSLVSFAIPAQLEILESSVFTYSASISELVFEIPSRLKQLHLPMDDFVSLSIPDSVEVLTGLLRRSKRHDRLLEFGRNSQLTRMHFDRVDDQLYAWRNAFRAMVCRRASSHTRVYERRGVAVGVFVCLSEGTMRRFRSTFEAF